MQIDRKEFIEELKVEDLLRENIRKVIRIVKNRKQQKLDEAKEEERYLRTIIRKVIAEGVVPDQDPAPAKSTGINVLEDLLKKIIPILQDDYKLLTTDEQQRQSFRAHILNGVKNSIAPMRAVLAAPDADDEKGLEEVVDIDIGDEEKFIDIEDKPKEEPEPEASPEEQFGAGLEDHDETGRNMAFQTYKKIESNIVDSYDLIANEEDRALFYDYLLTNLKLYFDKFEDELAGNMEEPTTPEYEKAKEEPSEVGGDEELALQEIYLEL
tara:strand:+ start:2711 stop:3514 length:804 start_codon:yes stop_codon:yes gene_type:complete